MLVDIINFVNKTDGMILNSGTLRADMKIQKGHLKNKELQLIFPMIDPIVVMKVWGDRLLALLENGVSSYPKLEGKFPIISGIRFEFDANLPPNFWINPESIFIKGEKLDFTKDYKISTKLFISRGKDGYTAFNDCEYLVDEHSGLIL